ncbi:S8 family serine peptidase [Raoultibacter timonensis]|uniref:S8 family serine peptidase n=1 Tax=Raoultibacter timonensis TaxID=1907662 RepID=UPI0026DAEEB1|nr:S8 family serine peptidase [Raoultibacter timonensis]
MEHRSQRHRTTRSLFVFLLSLLLAFSLMPSVSSSAAAEPAGVSMLSDARIQEMVTRDHVEGEAVVLVDNVTEPAGISARSVDLLDSAETLMSVSGAVYAETVANGPTASDDADALSLMSDSEAYRDGDALSIKLVAGDGLSTEELLDLLRDDPRVLMAEPNYRYSYDDEVGFGAVGASGIGQSEISASSNPTGAIEPLAPTTPLDLTDYQWAYENDGATLAGEATEIGFDVKPPSWASDRTHPIADNAKGTIAVIDTGIDYTHPDLSPVVRSDMQSYIDPNGAYASSGAHGYNTGSDQSPADPMDTSGHGTHCAGIIAGAWNDFGISGIANGVKLVAVRAVDVTSGSIIDGYGYLAAAVEGGLSDLVAINNSWGYRYPSQIFSVAVTELGKLGAVSVVASGNDGNDNDAMAELASTLQSNPYAVVVDSSTANGALSVFSNFGAATTDIVAPGSRILSTVPMAQASYHPEAVSSNFVYESYGSALATDAHAVLYGSEEDAVAAVNPIGSQDTSVHYDPNDAGSSWKIAPAEMEAHAGGTISATAYMAIEVPAADQASVSRFGLHAYANKTTTIPYFAAKVSLKVRDKGTSAETWLSPQDVVSAEGNSWAGLSVRIDELLGDTYELVWEGDRMLAKSDFGFVDTADPACALYIDSVGVAGYASDVAYDYKDGTSMATPAVTGAAGVLAKSEDDSGTAGKRAKLRAASLKGSTAALDGRFADLCTSGGSLDLSVDPSNYAPVINSASVEDSGGTATVTLEGYFFGSTAGTVSIGGSQAVVQRWTDNEITVAWPAQLASGSQVVRVERAIGRAGQKTFLFEMADPSPETALLDIQYRLPSADEGYPSGALVRALCGLHGSIYFLAEEDTTTQTSNMSLWAFDPDGQTWKRCSDLPGNVSFFFNANEPGRRSMTTYDGRILVSGMGVRGDSIEQIICAYDPLTDGWELLDGSSVAPSATLVNCDEELLFVGGSTFSESAGGFVAESAIVVYDPVTGGVSKVGDLPRATASVTAAVNGSTVYATSSEASNSQALMMARIAKTDQGYSVDDISSVLPDADPARANHRSLTATRDGLMLTGFSAVGQGGALLDQDTYDLDVSQIDQGARFEDFGKRASREALFCPASTAYDGRYYVVGASYYEDGGYALRAEAVSTREQPGDLYDITYHNVADSEHGNAVHYSPTSLPLSLESANREGATFEGWYADEAFSGSTLSSLDAGTVGSVELWARWTGATPGEDPNPADVPDNKTHTLSKVGDDGMAMVSLAALAVAACLLALYAVRRTSGAPHGKRRDPSAPRY